MRPRARDRGRDRPEPAAGLRHLHGNPGLLSGRLTAVAVAVAAAILAAEADADTRTVRVGDNWFVRSGAENPNVTVRKGDRVTWRWVGDSLHSVRVARGPVRFSSGTPKSSGTFSRRLRRRGTYRILCSVHPAKQKMTLRVR